VTRSFLALGSNLGNRVGYLRDAMAAIEETGELVGASPVYETEPVGGPDEQGAYLNLVVELDTAASPRELLALCQRLERAAVRVRTQHWGPRTLDVDVIWVDGVEVSEPDLVVPHPRLWERRFVLAPLADLAPDLVPPERLATAHGDVTLLGPLADLS
jgi:2-amino-4-hydroxy-6-hydroxymethyldihydropteridine diphosphokinase